jgi:hypothetical protein
MLIVSLRLDVFGWDGELLVTFYMARVTDGNQEDGMVIPGFIPLTGSLISVVLSMMDLQIGLGITKSATVVISIQNLNS